jgi:hypothetical protein
LANNNAQNPEKKYRVWVVGKDANAGFIATPNWVGMASNKNYIAVDENGIAIGGRGISLNTSSESVRRGGLFVNMNDFVRMIPGTIVTPIPPQIPFPPLGLINVVRGILPIIESGLI